MTIEFPTMNEDVYPSDMGLKEDIPNKYPLYKVYRGVDY